MRGHVCPCGPLSFITYFLCSAVDAHVGAFIFEEMLVKHLADKTRILVTNQVQQYFAVRSSGDLS